MMQSFADQNEITVDSLSQMIQTYIEQAVTDDWAEAILVAEIEDDESGLTYGRYRKTGDDNMWLCFDTDYTTYIVFDTLRQNLQELTGKPWTKATAKLLRGDSVNFSFEYEPQTAAYTP